jgi:seryl-tRNA synthetase
MSTLKGAKEMKTQIAALQKKTKDSSFIASAKAVSDDLTKLEEALHQTKAKSGQDVLNFPIRLDDKIAGVFESAAAGYVAPTKQVKETYWELKQQVEVLLKKFETIKKENVKALNDKVHQLSIPIIGI